MKIIGQNQNKLFKPSLKNFNTSITLACSSFLYLLHRSNLTSTFYMFAPPSLVQQQNNIKRTKWIPIENTKQEAQSLP
jgi:hypothetical protein